VAYIDESCLYLKENKCRLCEGVCENGAIDFSQTDKIIEVNVGAVILANGFEPYDPKVRSEYHYGEYANVVTSMDFERLLGATGPYGGEILRNSDKKHPHKIAWIQCVGSRQVIPGGNSYCSGVCCSYAQKHVILTKDHDADAQCTVFHNDIRSYGKDFEQFYTRASSLPGVRFIRSYVSISKEDPVTKNVTIRYATADDGVIEEEFDMVVLSIGLNPPLEAKKFADTFGIELTDHDFAKVSLTNPMETTKPGIFVSGAFQGPIDIPESVFSASGAGAQCGELLDYRRGNLSIARVYPEERDVSQEEPRIGVFVCHCGANISRIVDVPSTVDYCKTLPNVVFAKNQVFSCATNSAQEITDLTKELGLNRVVIAACSPRTLEPLFRDTVREAGINQYYFEFANIREHDSWVHAKEPEEATKKAWDIIRMSVARAAYLEPLQEYDLSVNKTALVVGGGVAGMNAALSIAKQGHQVHLIERDAELGGVSRRVHHTLEGLDVQAYLRELISQVYQNPMIRVYHNATITEAAGYLGNFATKGVSETGKFEIKHGAVVLATGAELYQPTEFMYGEDERVVTHLELDELIAQKDEKVMDAQSIVMIQCVGCRNEDRKFCARICCSEAVKNALSLKEIDPDKDVYILFRDMRTYGLKEDFYREAADKEVRFIRWEPEDPPEVEVGEDDEGEECLVVTVTDPILGKKLELAANIVSLAAAIIPAADTKELADQFKVVLSPDGFFKEAHVKLRPVEFATDGVYLCGLAHYPKHIPETINQAYGAAGRVLTLLSRDTVVASGSVCVVDEKKCMGCEACVEVCTYGALALNKAKKIDVNPVLCKGCGLCNTKCPPGAISLKHFTDQEINSEIDVVILDSDIIKEIDAAAGEV